MFNIRKSFVDILTAAVLMTFVALTVHVGVRLMAFRR
jgi:hypothetical protein